MELLLRMIGIGLTAAGIALLVRTLPWPGNLRQRKPLACAVCMGGWSALASMYIAFQDWPGWRVAVALTFGALAVSAWVFRQLFPPDVEL